ncbi:MAG: hypothetical protein IK092_05345, partial [Muribaculaceae bacterium]|nr:hypothetical protein [Muribaculaceae bacterium]
FGIELPATEGTYYVEGMVSIHNGNIQLYPTVIEETMTPMWKVWYMGEDGDQFTIADELYVDYVDNDEKLIYFTDNATTIIYDVYADWGYVWEEEWSPDWMAMDCDGDDELFETIKKMRVIKAGTLRGTLEDNYTNPRFVVTEAPEEDLDAEYPNIVYDEYDLKKDSLEANGGEIVYITGVYNAGNLEGVIASSGVKQVVPIIPLAGQDPFKKGGEYTVKAVVLQKEPWEPANEDEDDEAAAAPSKVKAINAAKRPMKIAVRKTPARCRLTILNGLPTMNFRQLRLFTSHRRWIKLRPQRQ